MTPRRMGTPPPPPLRLTRRGQIVVGIAGTLAIPAVMTLLEGLSVIVAH